VSTGRRRLAIIGAGRMGSAIAELAPQHDFEIVRIASAAIRDSGITRELLDGADVAVEFTAGAAAPGIIRGCAAAGCPVVSGTTGWEAERPAVEADIKRKGGALVWAPNFSIGVRLFARIVAEAGRQFAGSAFVANIAEVHHAGKKDAPSGTAKLLRDDLMKGLGREVSIESARTGTVVGTHTVTFDAPFEAIRLEHEAKDRRVFADGALVAARWLIGRKGVFTLDEVVGPT